MKLLIIGLDGLDYNLVTKWDLRVFKQKIYGKHYVGFASKLYTPILWSMFLTGLNVEKLGYDLNSLKEKRAMDSLKWNFLKTLYLIRKKIPVKELGLRKILISLGLAKRYPSSIMPEYLLKKTFLEKAKELSLKVSAIEVPGYNEEINEKYRSLNSIYVFKSLREKLSFINEIINDCNRRILKSLNYVIADYDLIFVYLPLPDLAHHLLFKNLRELVELRKIYGKLEKKVQQLTSYANVKNYVILIVSDHGFDMKNCYHSSWGFWSLNKNIEIANKLKKITDFHDLILFLLKKH